MYAHPMRGEHLYVHRRGYTHHAIDCGDGTVIHYTGVPGSPLTGEVKRAALEEFTEGARPRVRQHSGADPPDAVLARAESRLGEAEYNLVFNNCEHFCTWCVSGRARSRQVRRLAAGAAALVAAALPLLSRRRRRRAQDGA